MIKSNKGKMKTQGSGEASALRSFASRVTGVITACNRNVSSTRIFPAALVAAALLCGCAMTPNGQGGMIMSVDTAGLFGIEAGTFTMADGSVGTLRRATNGTYSVKLDRYMRVTPLQNAISARIARVETIKERTVVVIETQERGCAYKYEVLSISGSDVLQWKLGNCNDRPRVEKSADGQSLTLDFPNYNRITRNLYTDSRMMNATIPAPPGVDLQSKPFADQSLRAPTAVATDAPATGSRYVPAPPQADKTPAQPSAPAATTATPRARRNTRTSGSSPTPATPVARNTPAPLSFPSEEIKPIQIDLRK
jgi:hypothetical protein